MSAHPARVYPALYAVDALLTRLETHLPKAITDPWLRARLAEDALAMHVSRLRLRANRVPPAERAGLPPP